MASLKKTMFREYDIRGRESDDELNENSIYHIARGFGKMLRDANITNAVVGNDARETSESFAAQAKKALAESGVDIIDIGTVTTPMSYWAQYHFKARGLCMITASHNPAGWNGLKLGINFSETLGPDEIKTLYSIIEKEDYVRHTMSNIRKDDIAKEYMTDIVCRTLIKKKLKVLINTGNGTAGMFAPELFRKTGCEIVEHLTNVDPSYPNYTANPDGEAMMNDTVVQVLKNACDIGLAFDGDGDRLGVVDEKGNIVWPDRYLMLLSRLVLAKKPGSKIVFDVKVSQALPEDIAMHGGVPIMWKTGHSYIKAKLQEVDAALGGEMSGHIFFGDDFYGFDDAFFAALKLLEYLSSHTKTLSELVATTPYYIATPTIQVKTTDEEKYKIVDELVKMFKHDGYKVVDINGARVYAHDGWGLVRASSNTPTLVLRFEAKTHDTLEKIKALFREKLAHFKGVGEEWDTSGH
ncbi:MAG: Phosphomannomutase [Parcubacteria group bacterium Gr01-1014_8]|nr:MAG: Phosphomannomutase [Parcubacteria group bacterium Gr01-1014_8]